MTPKVEFHFDFGSPNAYFAHKVDPADRAAHRRQVHLRADPARRRVQAHQQPAADRGVQGHQGQAATTCASRSERFIKKHGLTKFKMNPNFPVNTVQIMRGAVAAEMDGQLAKYVDAVFRHMWEEGKKMDDPEVIRAALDASGLDGARTLARIQEQDVKDKLLKNTRSLGGARHLRRAHLLRRQRDLLRQGQAADVEEEIEAQPRRAASLVYSPDPRTDKTCAQRRMEAGCTMPAGAETSGLLLRHPPFAYYWFARICSSVAFAGQGVAVGWHLYALTGSALDLGLVGLVQFVPMVVLTLAVGHVADRYDRRRIVSICQLDRRPCRPPHWRSAPSWAGSIGAPSSRWSRSAHPRARSSGRPWRRCCRRSCRARRCRAQPPGPPPPTSWRRSAARARRHSLCHHARRGLRQRRACCMVWPLS